MKTQIIHIAAHDDLVTIRDRMAWAKTPRILLVWPRREKVALRPVDLALLQRRARTLGAQLGLVTRSEAIRREAVVRGIPVFESLPQAQRQSWPEQAGGSPIRRNPRPDLATLRRAVLPSEAAWRSHPITRISFFTLAVLAVLALAAGFLPRARVTVTVEKRTQEISLPVSASPDVQGIFLSGSLPAYGTGATVEGSQEAEASGELSIPSEHARGVVTFRNLTAAAVRVPAGTVVRAPGSPPVRFETRETADLDAGTDATVDVAVQALAPGAASNLDTGLIQAIEGDLGLVLAVSNPAPLAGGTDETVRAPDDADRAALRATLLDALEQEALAQMQAILPEGTLVFPDTLEVTDVLDETYMPPAGQPGSTLTLHLQVNFHARYAAAADMGQLARAALDAAVPQGFVPRPDTFYFRVGNTPVTDRSEITRWRMLAGQDLIRSVDARQVLWLAQGRRQQVAQSRLEAGLPLTAPAQVAVVPAWWPWLPIAPFRVEVVVQ